MVDKARLNLYVSHADRCGYLDAQLAVNLFADPRAPMTASRYSLLVRHGFRRSGDLVYRPHCPSCSACLPLRLPVDRFRPSRSQRRARRRNLDLEVRIGNRGFSGEQYLLYERYLKWRHPGGGMDNTSYDSFRQFLGCGWMKPWFVEFRLQGRLVCVAVSDLVARMRRPHLYLGYWIEQSPKMAYKSGFSPAEVYRDPVWEELRPRPGD